MPELIRVALSKHPEVVISCRTPQPIIGGDFDGDSRPDSAALITERHSGKRGFLLAFGKGGSVIVGAGCRTKYGSGYSSDLNFDHWELHHRAQSVESAAEQVPLTLKADALLVSFHEGASGLFYWDGRSVRWYQQGD